MENSNNDTASGNAGKPAQDKIHSMFGEEQAANEDLSYDEEKGSYELDRSSDDPDYDHPLPYDTTATNGEDDNSTYDEANPYIGNEYADKNIHVETGLNDMGMHVAEEDEIVKLSPEDEILARTPEDDRDDLDEEGYPVNDSPIA